MSEQNGERRVQVQVQGVCEGYPVSVGFELPLAQVQRAVGRLRKYGITPQASDWQRTPEGEPICPAHNVVMQRREKQGDVWWSHKVLDNEGRERYCRGHRHGPADDDGFLV
jgi:hypothetical protein